MKIYYNDVRKDYLIIHNNIYFELSQGKIKRIIEKNIDYRIKILNFKKIKFKVKKVKDKDLEKKDKHCPTCICDLTDKIFNQNPEETDDHCETCICNFFDK